MTIGFVGTTALLGANEARVTRRTPGQLLGTPDIEAWCQDQHGAGATVVQRNADWWCLIVTPAAREFAVSPTTVCQAQFDEPVVAVLDVPNPNAWACRVPGDANSG